MTTGRSKKLRQRLGLFSPAEVQAPIIQREWRIVFCSLRCKKSGDEIR